MDEAKSVTEEIITLWLETTILTILSQYLLQDFFNAGEFSLFYRSVPNKIYHFKNKKCTGGKYSKVHLTGMAADNVNRERLPMFVIGKSKTLRCLKGVENVRCCYRAEPKSSISPEMFEE